MEASISIVGKLSDDAHQQAGELQRLFAAWAPFVEALKGIPLEPRITMLPPKSEPTRRRRGRPRLAVAEPPTAA